MTDTAKLTSDHLAIQQERLAGKTVAQMDSMLPPGGRYAFIASQTVRLERLNEERHTARVLKLRTMFPGITDLQLNDVDLEDESSGGGLTIRLKEVEEPELG